MPANSSSKTYVSYSYLILAVLAMTYLIVRGASLAITFDEAWTIKDFVSLPFIEIINYTPCDANNHILNTLLIKLFFAIAPEYDFVARMPNLLAAVMGLFFAYKMTSRWLASWLGLSCFVVLFANPFLLDFLALARGYGLSIGMLLASLYYLFDVVEKPNLKGTALSTLFGALAVLSNFALLNYYVALLGVLVVLPILAKHSVSYLKWYGILLAITAVLAGISYEPIRKMRLANSLYYGGSDSFYEDTLSSLTHFSMYSKEASAGSWMVLNVFLILLLLGSLLAFWYKRTLCTPKNAILAIFIIATSSVVMQHVLLGTLFLQDRTALFFYPIVVLVFFFAVQDFADYWSAKVLAGIVTTAVVINCCWHANFYKTVSWEYDAHTSHILAKLNEISEQTGEPARLDFAFVFVSGIYHRLNQKKYTNIHLMRGGNDQEVNPNSDYYMYYTDPLNDANHQINQLPKDTFAYYPEEQVIVFKIRK